MIAALILALALQASASTPDWQLIGKDEGRSAWIDVNSISGPINSRRVTVRLMIGADGSFGFADTSVDCLIKRSMVLAVRVVDASGKTTSELHFKPNEWPSRDYGQDADAQTFDAIVCRRVT